MPITALTRSDLHKVRYWRPLNRFTNHIAPLIVLRKLNQAFASAMEASASFTTSMVTSTTLSEVFLTTHLQPEVIPVSVKEAAVRFLSARPTAQASLEAPVGSGITHAAVPTTLSSLIASRAVMLHPLEIRLPRVISCNSLSGWVRCCAIAEVDIKNEKAVRTKLRSVFIVVLF
jgi:hypothetical protein